MKKDVVHSERFFRDYFYDIEYLSTEELGDIDTINDIYVTKEYNGDIEEFYDDNKLNYIQELFSYENYPADVENYEKDIKPEESSTSDWNTAHGHSEEIDKAGVTFPIGEIWNALETNTSQGYKYHILL